MKQRMQNSEQPTRLRIWRGESPRAVNCLNLDGQHIRCMHSQQGLDTTCKDFSNEIRPKERREGWD
jgi:hypothetical protein